VTPAPGTGTAPAAPVTVAPGLRLLRGAPDDPALLGAGTATTYAELQRAVDRTADLLGPERRLVLLEAADDVATVTTYLAALAGGHPVLLVGPGDATRHAALVERYRPDVVQGAGQPLHELRAGTAHDLHPDLAVLLSTSGSTGSPKLVRLSRANVEANARSIGDFLAIRPTDRALASLPLHYSYGLSVLNSHLLAGAAVVLTDLSVADECFWALAAETRATSFAGVPYTFELLDASGFERRDLPDLRYVTQAGGRMQPERVRRFAELGRQRGWDLFVMYGQTEATARIAYLPPDRAADRPQAVGVPIPGGALRVDPVDRKSVV
jgi:acyl-coenzyme A synthetase/AMP-(fatty) acid ligase